MLTSNPKHLLQLSGALVLLPYAILSAVSYRQEILSSAVLWDLIWGRLAAEYYRAYAAALADPAAANQLVDITHRIVEPFSIQHTLPSILCSLFIFFVSIPALMVSLCRAYVNINAGSSSGHLLQSLKAVLAVARKARKSLFVLGLCRALAWLGFIVIELIVCVIVLAVVTSLSIRPEWVKRVVHMDGIAIVVAGMCLAALWRLSDGVAVLEGRSGLAALARSAHLVAGRSPVSTARLRTRSWANAAAALCVVVFLFVAGFFLTGLLAAARDIPTSATPTHVAIAVGVVAFRSSITLIRILAIVLLYLSCRTHHQESLETLAASLTSGQDIPYVALTSIEVAPRDTNHEG